MRAKMGSVVLFFLFTWFSSTAFANGYIGASLGRTTTDEDGFKGDSGFRITGGYNVNENISLEASYADLGEFDADGDTLASNSSLVGFTISDASVEISGFEFSILGAASLTDSLSAFGKFGIYMWDAELNATAQGIGSGSDSEDGNDPMIGVGLSYKITDNVDIKCEYDRYDAYEADVDYASIGIGLAF